jgi:hypothetical protein
MSVPFPEIQVGEPMRCGSLTLFPLFSESTSHLDYLLSEEAMTLGTVAVQEVSERGSVPKLLVDNAGERMVLFLEGEELRGAKQNRVLNTSVLVAAQRQTTIPVTCVEQGRWDYSSRQFHSGCSCPPLLKQILKGTIWQSQQGHSTDQVAVWQEVRRKHRMLGVVSSTGNLCDALLKHRERLDEVRASLPYAEGALGIAVALAGKFIAIDIFDAPATLAKLWNRMIEGLVLDMLEIPDIGYETGKTEAANQVYKVQGVGWKQVSAVGLGEEYRARGNDGMLAAALVADGVLVHASASMPFPG